MYIKESLVQGLYSLELDEIGQSPEDNPQLPHNAGEGAARVGPGEEVRVRGSSDARLQTIV